MRSIMGCMPLVTAIPHPGQPPEHVPRHHRDQDDGHRHGAPPVSHSPLASSLPPQCPGPPIASSVRCGLLVRCPVTVWPLVTSRAAGTVRAPASTQTRVSCPCTFSTVLVCV